MGEKLGVGWRILSAALIDVTPKKPQESEKRAAAKCASSRMSELQLPSFHEVMHEVHTSEKESTAARARLHCPRRGHTPEKKTESSPVCSASSRARIPRVGNFVFPPPPPFAQKRMRQTAQSLISPQRKTRTSRERNLKVTPTVTSNV